MATTPYVDTANEANPTVGTAPLAAWGDQIRTNQEFLVDRPRVKAWRTTTQSIPHATAQAVGFTGTDEYDTDDLHDPTSNSSRITIPAGLGGLWLICCQIDLSAGTASSARRQLSLRLNGSWSFAYSTAYPRLAGEATTLQTYGLQQLSAGDYVQAVIYQTTGGARNLTGAWMTAHWVARI